MAGVKTIYNSCLPAEIMQILFGEKHNITNFAHIIDYWFYITPLKFHVVYAVQLHVLDYYSIENVFNSCKNMKSH